MSKPTIGLNADFRRPKGDTPAFAYIQAGYFDAVSKAGGIPIVMPPLEDLGVYDCQSRRVVVGNRQAGDRIGCSSATACREICKGQLDDLVQLDQNV